MFARKLEVCTNVCPHHALLIHADCPYADTLVHMHFLAGTILYGGTYLVVLYGVIFNQALCDRRSIKDVDLQSTFLRKLSDSETWNAF